MLSDKNHPEFAMRTMSDAHDIAQDTRFTVGALAAVRLTLTAFVHALSFEDKAAARRIYMTQSFLLT